MYAKEKLKFLRNHLTRFIMRTLNLAIYTADIEQYLTSQSDWDRPIRQQIVSDCKLQAFLST